MSANFDANFADDLVRRWAEKRLGLEKGQVLSVSMSQDEDYDPTYGDYNGISLYVMAHTVPLQELWDNPLTGKTQVSETYSKYIVVDNFGEVIAELLDLAAELAAG